MSLKYISTLHRIARYIEVGWPEEAKVLREIAKYLGDVQIALQCASAFNKIDNWGGWGERSPFQMKIEELVGAPPYNHTTKLPKPPSSFYR